MTTSEGYRWGNAAEGSVSVNATQSAGYMHNKTVAKQYNTYDSTSFDVSVSTGFMAEQLVAMAGGAEAFNAANSKFFDSFYTDVEKTNYTLATVTKQFKAMDVALYR